MMHKRFIFPALVGTLLLAACGGKQVPELNQQPTQSEQDRLAEEEARRRAEEEARRRAEEEARRRAEEEARRRAEAEIARANEILGQIIYFDFDSFKIRSDAEQLLSGKVGVLRANPEVTVRIEGHADERGSDEYNLALGMRRANAVKEFLTGYGLDASRFETVSLGEDRPVDTASGEESWAKNRRAEFRVVGGQVTRGVQQ